MGIVLGCTRDNSRIEKESGLQTAVPPPAKIDPHILRNRNFNEAPMLANRVASGELPPVAERLPENPLVVRPMKETGRYGGTLRRAMISEYSGLTGITKTLNDALLGYTRPVMHGVEPNLAESYSFSDEGRTAIIHLRKGVKWSDGHPFTVEDILFWYYDYLLDEDARRPIGPHPVEWQIGGEQIQFEKIDDYTLKATASQPMGMLTRRLCHESFVSPKHHHSPYHPRYNPNATYAALQKRYEILSEYMTPGTPMLSAWAPVEWVRGSQATYERNPYYWKVDTAGNQLPYADRISFTVVNDPQVLLLRFTNGEFDLIGRSVNIEFIPTLRSESKNGKYVMRERTPIPGPAFYLNWDADKPSLREAFRDLNVRKALSYALNRVEISEVIYLGLLEPGGYAFSPQSPYYSDENFKRYSEFSPGKARMLLEQAGYHDTDEDGYRELRDGSRFSFIIDATMGAGLGDLAELSREYWKDVGIQAHLNIAREEIIKPRRVNGEFDVLLYETIAGGVEPRNSPIHWGMTAPRFPVWHKNGREEAPDWLREATELITRASATIDQEEVKALIGRMQYLHSVNVPAIGTGAISLPWAAHVRLGNVPEIVSASSAYRGWSRPVFHEQIFIKQN